MRIACYFPFFNQIFISCLPSRSRQKGFANDFHYFLIKILCRMLKCASDPRLMAATAFPPRTKATNTEIGFMHKINSGERKKSQKESIGQLMVFRFQAHDVRMCSSVVCISTSDLKFKMKINDSSSTENCEQTFLVCLVSVQSIFINNFSQLIPFVACFLTNKMDCKCVSSV